MIDVELALAKQKISTLEAHLTATEQRAERAEAALATAQRAYEITRQDCWNLTEKVIPNIRQDLAAARALLVEANEMLAEAIVCGPKLREYMPLRQRIVAALAGEKSNGLS